VEENMKCPKKHHLCDSCYHERWLPLVNTSNIGIGVGKLVLVGSANTLKVVQSELTSIMQFVQQNKVIQLSLVANNFIIQKCPDWTKTNGVDLIGDNFWGANLETALEQIASVAAGAKRMKVAMASAKASPITSRTPRGKKIPVGASSLAATASPISTSPPTAQEKGRKISEKLRQSMNAAPSEVYLTVSMDIVPKTGKASAWHSLCNALTGFYGGLTYMTNSHTNKYLRAVLVFFGMFGTGSPQHVDFSAAATIAIAIEEADAKSGVELAWWMALKPSLRVIKRFNEFIINDERFKHKFPERGLSPPPLFNGIFFVAGGSLDMDLPVLTHADMLIIQSNMQPGDIFVLGQCHGDVAMPTPGWIHCVWNARPCLKQAYDLTLEGKYAHTSLSMRLFASGVFGQMMAEDYTSLHAYTMPRL
jgi:hypothetical protein